MRYVSTALILISFFGCTPKGVNKELLEYTLDLPNYCDHRDAYLMLIEGDAYLYGKTLEKSGWYGKWDTIYAQFCRHHLIWGDYELAKKHGRTHFFKRRAIDYLKPDYFVAEYLTGEPDTFNIRFSRVSEDREFIRVFFWDEIKIIENETMGFETLESEDYFNEWLESGEVLWVMQILATRLLKGEESESSENAILALLSNFVTESEYAHEFVRLVDKYGGSGIEDWLLVSIFVQRYAQNIDNTELVERLRIFRDEALRENDLVEAFGCLAVRNFNPDSQEPERGLTDPRPQPQ